MIRTPRRWAGNAGLTLIDTIVGLGLLLLSTATIGQFLVKQIQTGGSNTSYSTAYALAAEELDQEGALTFTVATNVLADTPERNMKHISVDITWNDPGASQHVTVETIFTAVTR
jgi:hypothetical protein